MMSKKADSPEAIFFDMDGLLVDTEPYWLATERELMAEFDVLWRHEDQMYCLGGPMKKVGDYMSSLANSRESSEWFIAELISRISLKFRNISLMPGIRSLLDEIEEQLLPCALVSASPRVLVDAVISSFEKSPFEVTISADDVERSKPHPDPYLKAAALLGVDIVKSLIIEDSPTGVTAARASGAKVIAVPHLAPVSPAPRCAIITTLEGRSLKELWALC
ncbi:MAG: HAD family phosphatase [Actinobacteria bacterium]|uniref:HAD family phosphatase n=1 Tax=Candidatus Fonsibacter lacus TaxID=2576439 RepID=A0A965GCU7_9PROT|nr:HAD family phosphatase [Candidatus Fonsibacter lacus]